MLNERCEQWVLTLPRVNGAEDPPKWYWLVVGPLVSDSAKSRLGDEEVAFLGAQAGSVITEDSREPGDRVIHDRPENVGQIWGSVGHSKAIQ